MSDRAQQFLEAWVAQNLDSGPLTHGQAREQAMSWIADAESNGIPEVELSDAAQGSVADYLLKIFGDAEISPP